jgi:sarcosine oxidase
MGSAAAYRLARAGKRVLGLDRFQPPHTFGSSHGSTRIIREAYFEHPLYVPLVRRAYELWAELEQESGRRLLLPTGGLMIGAPDGVLVSGARRSAEEHRLAHQVLSALEVHERFPEFRPSESMVAVWEPRSGILFPELAVQTHLELAARSGAALRYHELVQGWDPDGQGVHVFTASSEYQQNIHKKLAAIRTSGGGVVTRVSRVAHNLSEELTPLPPKAPESQPNEPKAVPVEIEFDSSSEGGAGHLR